MPLFVQKARGSVLVSRALLLSAVAVVTSALSVGGCSTSAPPLGGDANHEAFEHAKTGRIAQDLQVAQMVGTTLLAKELALTFDDGPGDRAAELSMYLKAEGIKAAWFVNGAHISATTLPNSIALTANANAILAQIQADGHLLANHTTTHRNLTSQVPTGQLVQELSETDDDISAYVTSGHWLFRPPYGAWNNTPYSTLSGSAMNKYIGPISWEFGGYADDYPNKAADYACWQGTLTVAGGAQANGTGYATTAQCGDAYLAEITSAAGPRRGIVLLHDPYFRAGQPANSTVDMVKYMVPRLKADGWTFVRVDEVPAIKTAIVASTGCDFSCTTCSGPGVAQCTSCDTDSHLSAGKCLKCSTCAAGTYRAAACTANSNTLCTACNATCATCTGAAAAACGSCNAGRFLDGTTCTTCTTCGAGKYQTDACTTTADTVCGDCDASCQICSGPLVTDCGTCAAGTYLSAGACKRCSTCAAGTSASKACTPLVNTTCAPCAAGTFAAANAATCTACAAGTYAAAGAASCTSCGKCDDGDACTTDACDASKGCTHATIAGCGVDASVPVTPTGDAGAGDGGTDATVAEEPTASAGGCAVTRDRGSRGGEKGALCVGVLGVALLLRRRVRSSARREASRS